MLDFSWNFVLKVMIFEILMFESYSVMKLMIPSMNFELDKERKCGIFIILFDSLLGRRFVAVIQLWLFRVEM